MASWKDDAKLQTVQQFTLAEVILLVVGMLIFSLLLLGMMNMEYITQMGAGNPA